MGTVEKPLISILMAIYEPRLDWLEEQLRSLNGQTYPYLRLYIRDDCSPSVPFETVSGLVEECITAFPYTLRRNERNLGSNKTFELLTQEAEGVYFAYCDQDDVWLPEKLTILQKAIESEQAELVCSDMYIIDGNGKKTADSITRVRKHHVFRTGIGLAPTLLISNFVTGCTMLLRADTAKSAVPFCPEMVHDQYLALFSAEKGKIVSLQRQLICYRIHDGNQTLMMAGVTDKGSYFRLRIEQLLLRLQWLKEHFPADPQLSSEIESALQWAEARKALFCGDRRAAKDVLRYRRFSPLTSLFETVFSGAPEPVFMFFIVMKRRNVL